MLIISEWLVVPSLAVLLELGPAAPELVSELISLYECLLLVHFESLLDAKDLLVGTVLVNLGECCDILLVDSTKFNEGSLLLGLGTHQCGTSHLTLELDDFSLLRIELLG